jgi:shikimate kinase
VAPAEHLVVVGPRAVGKSTVGRMVAAELGWPWRDSDRDLAATGGRGRELARAEGVDALHRCEAEHLLTALQRAEPSVIAAAASVVEDPRCLEALREPFVVWLWAPPDVLVSRLARGGHRRDLGPDPQLALLALAQRRDRLYGQVADLTIDASRLAPTQAAEAILARLPYPRRTQAACEHDPR